MKIKTAISSTLIPSGTVAHPLLKGATCLLALIGLSGLISTAQADPRGIMGGGNFVNGDTGTTIVNQYAALQTLGAKMCRMNLYPNNYWNGSAALPTLQD